MNEETKLIDDMLDEIMAGKRNLFEQIMAQSFTPMAHNGHTNVRI